MNNIKEPLWKQFAGDSTLRICEIVKNWGNISHQIGGLMPIRFRYMWDASLKWFNDAGVKMNKGGLTFFIIWGYRLLKATKPIADKTGYNHIELANEYLNSFCDNIEKKIDMKTTIVKSKKIRKEIIAKAEEAMIQIP